MLGRINGIKHIEAKKNSEEQQQCSGLQKRFRKTKLCVHHPQGGCKFGDECSFAHSVTELQSTPDLRKTQLCTAFLQGRCDDMNCDFAHADSDLRSNLNFFKKALCVWYGKGNCRHGSHCRFAHGTSELRSGDAVGLDAMGSEAKLLAAEDHVPQHENIESASTGNESAGSVCRSVSHHSIASTTSGYSGGPSVTGEASDSERDSSSGGSYVMDTLVEPMKVLQVDSFSLAGMTNSLSSMALRQAPLVTNMTTQSGSVNTPATPLYGRTSQSVLGELQEGIAVLTTRCLRLHERVSIGDDGFPGVFWNKDGQGLPRNNTPSSYLALSPQVPYHVERSYPN